MSSTKSIDQQVTEVIETIRREDRKFELIYISYDDQLMDEQVDEYIETGYVDSIHEGGWYGEAEWRGIDSVIEDLIREFDITDEFGNRIDRHDIDVDLDDELVDEIRERDVSNPAMDLVRNTPDILIRVDLNAEIAPQDNEVDYTNLCIEAGIPATVSNVRTLESIHAEQWWYGGELVVLVQASLEDARNLMVNGGVIDSPSVWIYDGWKGAAWGDHISGSILVEPGATTQDGRRGIDDICGLVHSAFADEIHAKTSA